MEIQKEKFRCVHVFDVIQYFLNQIDLSAIYRSLRCKQKKKKCRETALVTFYFCACLYACPFSSNKPTENLYIFFSCVSTEMKLFRIKIANLFTCDSSICNFGYYLINLVVFLEPRQQPLISKYAHTKIIYLTTN